MDIWNRAAPAVKALLWRIWASFQVLGPTARLRYGLDSPHLTGMTQGVLAPLAGQLIPWGVEVSVDPVFSGPTFSCRGEAGIRVYPHRIVHAMARIFTEPELYKGLWDLWTWHRSRKSPGSDGGEASSHAETR